LRGSHGYDLQGERERPMKACFDGVVSGRRTPIAKRLSGKLHHYA
jgi:hypothetical protein